MALVREREPLLALGRNERKAISEVTSDTFLSYLSPFASPLPTTHFARKLELSVFTPFIQDLYRMDGMDYILPDADREKLLRFGEGVIFNNPQIQQHITTRQQLHLVRASEQGRVETGQNFYENLHDGFVYHSNPVDGTYNTCNSVSEDLYKLADQDNQPLISIHRHPSYNLPRPSDSLPSDDDWTVFMERGSKSDWRLVKALMVLCPNIQILAVATASTHPLMTDSELRGFLDDWGNELKERKSLLPREHEAVYMNSYSKWEQGMREGMKELNALDLKRQQEGLSSEIEAKFHEEKARLLTLSTANLSLRDQPEYLTAQNRHFDGLGKVNNTFHLELAQSMGVKLYSSKDMRVFSEFSA